MRLAVLALALAPIAATTLAQTTPQVKFEPAKDISPTDGVGMFRGYCAPCHGTSGKGDGPAAAALNPKPANLTEFGKRHLRRERSGHTLQPTELINEAVIRDWTMARASLFQELSHRGGDRP